MIPEDLRSKLVWLAILLPGFLTMTIIGMIVDLGELTELQIVLYCLSLTLMIAIIGWLVSAGLIWLAQFAGLCGSQKCATAVFAGVLFLTSITSGVGLGMAAERDLFFVALRTIPITTSVNKRSANRPLVFLFSQNTAGRLDVEGDARPRDKKVSEAWVRIELTSGKVYEGWPEFYEIGSEPSEIYLSPACISASSTDLRPIEGPGIVIREESISTVIFLDRESSQCAIHWLSPARSENESGIPAEAAQ